MFTIFRKSVVLILIITAGFIFSETLFQVKDSNDRVVLDVSTDGLRVLNQGDTVMVISSSDVRVNLSNTKDKGLSRTFSVTTSTSKKGFANVLEVGTQSTTMREGSLGNRYTDFSPENIFIGLNTGTRTLPNGTWRGMSNIFLGNHSGYWNDSGSNNIFIGDSTGFNSKNTDKNIFIGNLAGYNTESDDPNYGSGNVFVGVSSGYSNLEGHDNVYLGKQSGEDNVNGSGNIFVGSWAGNSNTSSDNTILGGAAFYKNTSGNKNTVLGAYAGTNNLTGLGNVFLGYSAGYSETGSNKLYIENSNSSSPLIWGDFSSDLVRINGYLGVNATPSSSYGLYILGSSSFGVRSSVSTTSLNYTYGAYTASGGGAIRNTGIYATTTGSSGTNWAGYFLGNVYVSGTVSKSSDEVKIDHPLDPENKYLSHTGVSSDQMTTVYNGNTILDGSGSAVVNLPEWFEAFNKDFKYQLTAIGSPGPNLYISGKIANNSFKIAGGVEGMEVSWQVTAVRKDEYAKSNPVKIVEEKKPEDKGYFLHPAAFGQPEQRSIEYQIQKRSEKEIKDK